MQAVSHGNPHAEAATKLWHSLFGEQAAVSVKEFLAKYAPAVGGDATSEADALGRGLRAALANVDAAGSAGGAQLSLSSFVRLAEWFGPADAELLPRLLDVLLSPWFHGLLPARDAEALVTRAGPGSFLVRFSTSEAGAFAITAAGSGTATHYRVERLWAAGETAGWLRLGQVQAASLLELVARLERPLRLARPAPGSSFRAALAASQTPARHYESWET